MGTDMVRLRRVMGVTGGGERDGLAVAVAAVRGGWAVWVWREAAWYDRPTVRSARVAMRLGRCSVTRPRV
jgi:hypothetical protein